MTKQINISTFWLSSVALICNVHNILPHHSPTIGSLSATSTATLAKSTILTSLLPLTIHPQWAHFPLLPLPLPPLEGATRIWLPVFTLLLLTLIPFILSLLLINTTLLQRRSESQELPQLKRTRHSQPIQLLSQLQPGR